MTTNSTPNRHPAGDEVASQDPLTFTEVQNQILSRAPEHQIDPTLDRVRGVLERLGNPQNNLKIVHITGTNGKTSTAAMTRNLLCNAGLKTGLFTSPHIFNITERIQVMDRVDPASLRPQDDVNNSPTDFSLSPSRHPACPIGASQDPSTPPAHFLIENSKLAARAAEVILGRPVTDEEVNRVLREPIARGRFEEREIEGVNFIFDVAHNPHGAQTLRTELERRGFSRIIAVIAQFADKDSTQYLETLKPSIDELIVTTNSSPRAKSHDELAEIAERVGLAPTIEPNLQSAIEGAVAQAQNGAENPHKTGILVTGSVITVADALALLEPAQNSQATQNLREEELAFQTTFETVYPEVLAFESAHPELGRLSFFEVLVVMMYVRFNAEKVDAAIVEVGMGGRWDATNVMSQTAVSVITPIALDHQNYLGETIEQIAREKAGILKPRTPAVIAPQLPKVAAVLEEVCDNINHEQ